MIYYIKFEGDEAKTYDAMGTAVPAELIKVDDSVKLIINGDETNQKLIKGYHVTAAKEEGSYIKVNMKEGSKVRRVSEITKSTPNINSHTAIMANLDKEIVIKTMSDYEFNDALFTPLKSNSIIDDFFSTEGGIYPGVKIMVNGEPGTMKSSNLYQLLQDMAINNPDAKVCYVSAEMGALDAKRSITKWYTKAEKLVHMAFPGDYLGGNEDGVTATQYLIHILSQGWDLVVLDSLKIIQNMLRMENGFSSDDKAEQWLLALLDSHSKRADNKLKKHTSFLIIQQSNRSGSIAGSATLEYMINGTIVMRVDKKERGLQYMEFKKNRSGRKGIRLYYDAVKEKGIVYNEAKYKAELEFMDILSGANVSEDGEATTGTAIANLIQRASDIKSGKIDALGEEE